MSSPFVHKEDSIKQGGPSALIIRTQTPLLSDIFHFDDFIMAWNISNLSSAISYIGEVTKLWLSCYLVLLSIDSETRLTRQPQFRDLTDIQNMGNIITAFLVDFRLIWIREDYTKNSAHTHAHIYTHVQIFHCCEV